MSEKFDWRQIVYPNGRLVLPFRLAFDEDPLKSVIEFHVNPASEVISDIVIDPAIPRKLTKEQGAREFARGW